MICTFWESTLRPRPLLPGRRTTPWSGTVRRAINARYRLMNLRENFGRPVYSLYIPLIAPQDLASTLDLVTGAFGADPAGVINAGLVNVVLNEDATQIREPVVAAALVDRFALTMRGSNPCRGPVELSLALPRSGKVEVSVFDVAGRRVWSDVRSLEAGMHELTWDGSRQDGSRVAPGVFLVKARVSGESDTQRVVLVR